MPPPVLLGVVALLVVCGFCEEMRLPAIFGLRASSLRKKPSNAETIWAPNLVTKILLPFYLLSTLDKNALCIPMYI